MNPSVSIIVPVYNARKTIARCIESIINQEFQDFELLLVNDGSKDDSGQICDSYAAQDKRIRVIHKDNSGVSDSRNMALDLAKGKYIQFLDSDDWITTDATNLFFRAAEDHHCDMVISDFYRVVGQRVSHKGDIDDDAVMTREDYAAHMMENPADFYYGVLWNKFFRREIIEQYHLRMDSSISWCEDFMFNLEYIRHASSFYALGVPIYYYVKTKGSLASQGLSLTKTINMKKMVFAYYHNFYKSILTEEDYAKDYSVPVPDELLHTVHVGEVTKEKIRLSCDGKTDVIQMNPHQIVTTHLVEEVPAENGYFKPDGVYNKICVVERHGKTGEIGVAPLKGFGVKGGAVATSVAHDSHNLIVTGDNDEDILAAIKGVEENQGGYVIASGGKVVDVLPLPICGLMSEKSCDEITEKVADMLEEAKKLGISEDIDPFITLSFMALTVIPEIRVTERGVYLFGAK